MKTTTTLAFLSLALCCASAADADTFGSGAIVFDIEFVGIGNPGNPADTTGNPNPAGKVEYGYRMGKYEISEDMINKANALGALGLTHNFRGANKPATSISWFEAAQFVNWLNTSQGHQVAYNFDANNTFQLWSSAEAWQDGGENRFRHKDAFYFLPSVDEWYKAAYYDATAGVYYDYPTGSDTAPTAVASGTAADTAVYDHPSQGPADIMLAGGLSPYGTMGQGGNVREWEETEDDLVNDSSSSGAARGVRGGNWVAGSRYLLATYRDFGFPADDAFGFRVASIPEPSTALLGTLATGGLLMWRRRLG